VTRPTADASADRPEDWEAPGAALVRSAATDVIPPLADLSLRDLRDQDQAVAPPFGALSPRLAKSA